MITMESVTMDTEKDIVFNLRHNIYELKQLDDEFIMYCKLLLDIQIYAFESMFDGRDITGHIGYSDGAKLTGSENDLLISANTAKLIYPILKKVIDELETREIDYKKMRHNSILSYAKIHGIIVPNEL